MELIVAPHIEPQMIAADEATAPFKPVNRVPTGLVGYDCLAVTLFNDPRIAPSSMIDPPCRAERHHERQPEQVADGEAETHE